MTAILKENITCFTPQIIHNLLCSVSYSIQSCLRGHPVEVRPGPIVRAVSWPCGRRGRQPQALTQLRLRRIP
eukprot:scaffold643961_cov19-Prasinocladus_malaysianus.AAC.1